MPKTFVNRAKMTTATVGTGTLTLGSASSGYQTFAAAGVANGNDLRYLIQEGTSWEIGSGTYTSAGTTLSRTLESSSTGLLLVLLGGATVLVTAAAADVLPVDALPTASTLVLRDANANAKNNNTRQGYATTATAAGTTALTVASTYLQFLTGTLAQTVTLPDVTTLVLGHQFYIRNNSTGLVTINSSGGNLVRILGPGTRAIVTCILTTGTTAASWASMYLGISIADGKVLTASNSLTLAGTDGTTMTFPATSASIARTDAAQTLAGTQTFGQQQIWTGLATDPASPADGTVWYDSQIRTAKVAIGSRLKDVFADLVNSGASAWKAIAGGTSFTGLGMAGPTAVGTATAASIATTNKHSMYPRVEALVTVAATTAVAGWRFATNLVTVGGASADTGGFRISMIWGPATGVATTTNRGFAGLKAGYTPTDVEPSSLLSCVLMGWDAADTNIQMMFNDGTATATKVDLGASFPVPTVDRTSVYKLEMFSPKGTTQSVQWRVTDMVSGAVATGTQTTDLPATSALLAPHVWMSVGGTSSVIGVALMSMYLDPLL